MSEKKEVEKTVREIRRKTRKKYSAEEKNRIVLEGLRGESTISELCRREGIHPNIYYKWSKEFLEAGNMVEVCVKAYEVLKDPKYLHFAKTAFLWYLGKNILGLPMIDNLTGGIYDGLESQKVNQNEGDEQLKKHSVFVIPDFLCNAGGVSVSYFESVQNDMNYYWPRNEVLQRLDEKITIAFQSVYEMYEKEKVFMRDAAYMVAINRVVKAMQLRGWI